MLQIDESFNEREVELQVAQKLEVALHVNPTTGFRWELQSSGAPTCVLVRDVFEAPDGRVGQGGRHRWQFQAAQVGRGHIELASRRPWEQERTPAQRFSLHVLVAD